MKELFFNICHQRNCLIVLMEFDFKALDTVNFVTLFQNILTIVKYFSSCQLFVEFRV